MWPCPLLTFLSVEDVIYPLISIHQRCKQKSGTEYVNCNDAFCVVNRGYTMRKSLEFFKGSFRTPDISVFFQEGVC